jgi:hypothetical protein
VLPCAAAWPFAAAASRGVGLRGLATRVKPYTIDASPRVTSTAPGMSYSVSPGALLSGTIGMARATASSATGRLTQKHQRQSAYSVSTPPSSRPTADPPPAMAP